MDITGVSVRVVVDDLDAAIAVYERLTGSQAVRFQHAGADLAAVGCFFLMSGPEEVLGKLRRVAATITVADVDDAVVDLAAAGAQLLAGPSPTPVGRNLLARHPDGSVFEYVDRQPVT